MILEGPGLCVDSGAISRQAPVSLQVGLLAQKPDCESVFEGFWQVHDLGHVMVHIVRTNRLDVLCKAHLT